jgi:hypothetical protein
MAANTDALGDCAFVIARQLEHMGLVTPGRLHGEAREMNARKKHERDAGERTDAGAGGSPENLHRRMSGTDIPLRRRSGEGQSPGYGAPVGI